jgi:hypothetical protein
VEFASTQNKSRTEKCGGYNRAMGREAANVHLGTKNQVKRVLRDLSLKKSNWLRRAGKKMAKAIEKDWREYS